MPLNIRSVGWILLLCASPLVAAQTPFDAALKTAVEGDHRQPEHVLRDTFRHPFKTISFFGIQPHMAVVEISPGGGWYTDVLAAYLKEGVLYAAHGSSEDRRRRVANQLEAHRTRSERYPDIYKNVKLVTFDAALNQLNSPEGAVDAVVTFRNVHNWLSSGSDASAFRLFFKTLKPGGVLGVVEHRAQLDITRETMQKTGYMTQSAVIELAESAGFVFEKSSEINANPLDTTEHPRGVWTLPPRLALDDDRRQEYLAIGESDRMTLRFRKPQL